MEIARNLHWIECRLSNVYLWTGGPGILLVDTGFVRDADKIRRYLHHIGRSPADITAIFVTHADVDHAWSVATLAKESDARVWTGEMTADYLQRGRAPDHLPRFAQIVQKSLFRYKSLPPEFIDVVTDGERVDEEAEWLALSTPGHTEDHFALYSPVHGVLFAGDALNTRDDTLSLSEESVCAELVAARRSAMRLLRLHPAVIACGHGRPSYDHDAGQLMTLYRQLEEQIA